MSLVLFGLGCSIFGAIIGLMIYGGTWYYDSTRVALFESLNVNTSFAGLVYGLLGSLGLIMLIIGAYSLIKKNR
jgi:hypothetical protein